MAQQISAGSLVVNINADDAEFQSGVNRVQTKLRSFADKYQKFSTSLNSTSVAVSNLIVNPLKAMLTTFSQVGAGLDKMTKQIRLSVAELGQFEFAAEQSGAKSSDVHAAFSSLADKMQRARLGDFGARQEIRRGSGLNYDDLAKMDTKEQFLAIVDVIQKTEAYADKAEIARRMFGSDALLPMLEKGREGIQKLAEEADALGGLWSAAVACKELPFWYNNTTESRVRHCAVACKELPFWYNAYVDPTVITIAVACKELPFWYNLQAVVQAADFAVACKELPFWYNICRVTLSALRAVACKELPFWYNINQVPLESSLAVACKELPFWYNGLPQLYGGRHAVACKELPFWYNFRINLQSRKVAVACKELPFWYNSIPKASTTIMAVACKELPFWYNIIKLRGTR